MLLGMTIAVFGCVYANIFIKLNNNIPESPIPTIIGRLLGNKIYLEHNRGDIVKEWTIYRDEQVITTGYDFSIGELIVLDSDCIGYNIRLIDNNNRLIFWGLF